MINKKNNKLKTEMYPKESKEIKTMIDKVLGWSHSLLGLPVKQQSRHSFFNTCERPISIYHIIEKHPGRFDHEYNYVLSLTE